MNEEYYIGKIFYNDFPPEAAEWCRNNDARIMEIEQLGDMHRFEIQTLPEPPAPTREDISNMRKSAYTDEVDPLHAERQRKTVLGKWTEEMEADYIQQVIEKTANIEARYPYPEEQ